MDFKTLLEQNEHQRDSRWEETFLSEFPKQKVVLDSAESKVGPDHWPYLFARSYHEEGESCEKKEVVEEVLHWLSEEGIGLVFNAQNDLPDYVFTYGMIWNYRETGCFHQYTSQVEGEPKETGRAIFEPGQEIFSGLPDIKYIPQYVRNILEEFFSNQGFKEKVRWLLVSGDRKHYDLCFSIESLGKPKKEEHLGIVEALSWFFPLHFSIVLVSEEHLPPFYKIQGVC